MSPHAVLISDNDLSNAFHDQFSTIIRLESRLQGDHSEDVTGPAHQLWVVRHLTEVAHAQRITSQLPAQMMTANVHAPEFITPSHARVATASRSQHITPWYDNFFLADQRITDSSSPNRYNLFDPAELATCPTATRAQLRESSDQNVRNQYNATIGRVDSTTYSVHGSTSRHPSTPPNTFPRAQYPSTPPNQSSRHHHRRRTSQLDFLPDLTANRSYTTVRASTEPTAESRMGSLAAPDHYQPFEVRALDVQIGDHIQSVQNPGT